MENSDIRLPRWIRPSRYRLHFEVYPLPAKFEGSAEIDLVLDRAVEEIQLHAAELEVTQAAIGEERLGITLRPEVERVALRLPKPQGPGEIRLSLRFQAPLQKGLRGLYRATAGDRAMAFTQFEPADARRAFPCFDEPDFKAIFEISATVPEGLQVISNGPLVADEAAGAGKRRWRFAPTPLISTYLVALGIGDLAHVDADCGGVPVRVWALPEKLALGKPALEMACAFLPLLADYFGLPYPYQKLDLVAVPDFEAGAMENAGALFFRESTLLLDPEKATLEATRHVAIVVAHEMAHQWFGDLVTMEWWDDLWLNEAFATWMEFVIVDQWKPEWNLWTDFERMKAHPLYLDSLRSTRPIQAEVRTPEQANEMFDGITYSKGAAVLRMFEVSLGAERFKQGVRAYLAAHQSANAKAAHLWEALAQATGRPVGELARSWFTQGGYPLLSVALQGQSLRIRQRRFFAKPAETDEGARWRVPLAVKLGSGKSSQLVTGEIDGESGELALPPQGSDPWLLGNAEGSGFYRVAYEPAALTALAAHREALLPVERISLLNDQWALVRAGAPLAAHLPLVDGFAADRGRAVLETVMGQLSYLEDVVLAEGDRQAWQRWAIGLLSPHLRRLGWDPPESESIDDRMLRPSVIEVLGAIGADPAVRAEAHGRVERWLANGSGLHPSVLGAALRLAAAQGDAALYDKLLARMRDAQAPEDRDRLLSAVGAFEAPELVGRALQASLGPDVRAQDMSSLIGQLFGNRRARRATWTFVQQAWTEVATRAPVFGLRRIVSATARLCDAELRREIDAFFSLPEHHVEAGERDLRQALEAIDLGLSVRSREQANLGRWLAGQGRRE
jgi:puromycin-sensitive aminopeptidase